ncbi:hypothetical protein D9M73_262100 [compost metagenome]
MQHHLARRGDLQPRRQAFEEQHAKFVLELLDRGRQRRLGDMQLLRGTAEIQGFGESEQLLELTKFHGARC